MIKCITVVDGKADLDALLDRAPRGVHPSRLALCTVRKPGDIPAIALSWHADRATMESFFDARPTTVVVERVARGDAWLADRWTTRRDHPTLLLIGFIQRAAQTSREEFGHHWWYRHRPLADSMVPAELNPMAYVHNYVASDEPSQWDGIGELYEQSLHVASQRADWFGSDAATPLIEDEKRFINRDSRNIVVTDHEVLIADMEDDSA